MVSDPAGPAGGEILVPWREMGRAALLLASLVVLAYWGVVFHRGSLVYSDNYNPLDPRPSAASYGPGFVRHYSFLRRGLLLDANFHDPGGAWWQWEPGAVFLRRGLLAGELPWWDPYVGAGAPAMANAIPTFFFPPYLAVVLLGDTPLLRTALLAGPAAGGGPLLVRVPTQARAGIRRQPAGRRRLRLLRGDDPERRLVHRPDRGLSARRALALQALPRPAELAADRGARRRLRGDFAVELPAGARRDLRSRRPLCPGDGAGRRGRRRGGAREVAELDVALGPLRRRLRPGPGAGGFLLPAVRGPGPGGPVTSRRPMPLVPGPRCPSSASTSCCRRP